MMTRKMHRLAGTLVCLAILAGLGVSNAAEPDLRTRLEKRVHQNEQGESLPYRLFVPRDYDAARQYPLILFLHGAGERGDDNEAQLVHAGVLRFTRDDVQAEHPAFLVAPQCPKGRKWVEVEWDFSGPHQTPAEPSLPMKLTLDILAKLAKEYSIDRQRIYVTGLSMGGFGTFDLCARHPEMIAAAMPICGGADDSKAEAMKEIAFWVFHGSADTTVPPVRSRSAVEALRKAGAEVKYTEYEGVGHNSWSRAYDESELVDWLFSHHR